MNSLNRSMRNIADLTEKEKIEIKTVFSDTIDFRDYFEPPPLPPPAMNAKLKIE